MPKESKNAFHFSLTCRARSRRGEDRGLEKSRLLRRKTETARQGSRTSRPTGQREPQNFGDQICLSREMVTVSMLRERARNVRNSLSRCTDRGKPCQQARSDCRADTRPGDGIVDDVTQARRKAAIERESKVFATSERVWDEKLRPRYVVGSRLVFVYGARTCECLGDECNDVLHLAEQRDSVRGFVVGMELNRGWNSPFIRSVRMPATVAARS